MAQRRAEATRAAAATRRKATKKRGYSLGNIPRPYVSTSRRTRHTIIEI